MNLGSWHPIIVHFVVALLYVGVIMRIVSLTGRLKFTGPAALVLILVGTTATVLAVKSGEDAHGPVERIPGVRPAVETHERWGENTRNIFLGVVVLELAGAALGLGRFESLKRLRGAALAASAVVGVAGLAAVYTTADQGGDLVYSMAGGVGTREGEDEDLRRLLISGLYHNAMLDRAEGRADDAARLIDEMARRFPGDPEITLLRIESLVIDRGDGDAALALLRDWSGADDRRTRRRVGFITADAWMALGFPDSARVVLERMRDAFPDDQAIRGRLDNLP